MNRRAVAYVRISKDRSNETSMGTQEERLRAYCKAHGWRLVDVIPEQGRSAYKASRSSRPGFRRAMQMIEAGAADVLLVWKIDRACRSTEDTLALVRELGEYNPDARLVSVTESFDTGTPSGRMTMSVLAALAEMESATKSERIQAWQENRIVEGKVPTGPRPYGYRRSGPNELTIDRAEAAVIRKAATRLLAGQSLRSVQAVKDGQPMTRQGLRDVLRSPTIAGGRMVDGLFVRGSWDPILDQATWEKVRGLLNDPARRSAGNGRRWLLSGIAQCSRCQVGMQYRASRAGPRYTCPDCHLSIDTDQTDEVIEDALLDLLDAKTWRRMRQGRPMTGGDSEMFEAAMRELSDRFVAGDIDGAQLAELAEALRSRQEIASAPPPSLPDVADLRKAWPMLDVDQRRLVLTTVTESLTILPWQHRNGFDESRVQWEPVA